MSVRARLVVAAVALVPLGAACGVGGDVVAVPTTTAPAPTTTVPAPAPTTTVPTTTTTLPYEPHFSEDFTGDLGLERFRTGVYHREEAVGAVAEWLGDHNEACGEPSTQRIVHRDDPDESFYVCREHLMTSVGDTSGYSIAWFTPDRTFLARDVSSVSFAVNVTDLGSRQWWEVSIVPVGAPYLATVDWVASTAGIDTYDPASIVVGNGPYGGDASIVTGGVRYEPLGYARVCGPFAADPEGCASKAIRRTFTITDHRDGTVTFDYLGASYTYPGAFPDEFEVYFQDHNYTPDKDGLPVGHTWHWDDIVIE